MKSPAPLAALANWRAFVLPTLAAVTVSCAAHGAPASANLPDTPTGKLGSELIRHVNADSAEKIRSWAPTILSSTLSSGDQADVIRKLTSTARDSGGVDVIDVRTPPNLLVLTLKGRRTGQQALLVLAGDPAHADKLGQVDLMPMDDPAVFAAWPKTAVPHDELARVLRTTLDQLVRTADFSGCLSVVDGATTVFDECRGLAERSFRVPVDRQTRFHIGSINKMFTAVAIAQLVEAGKLSWDATVAQWIPDYPDQAAAKQITVWQLLHHTSGLGDFLVPEFFEHRERFVDPADYLDLIARQAKVSEPGEQWNYSNAGYILLGRIIENVSHEGYFDYIQRHVFATAGMDASGFDHASDITPKLAAGYYREGPFSTEWKSASMKLPLKGSPAGGGYSTNTDLLRFAKALREGRLLKPATVAKMFDDAVPAGPGHYAAGFGDRLSHERHIRGHAGGIEGTDANLQMVWETDATVALTSNQGPGQTWMLVERIADLLAAAGAKP